MSCMWNGHALPSRADTVASRCSDIIERGIRRLGLDLAPRPLARVLAGSKRDREGASLTAKEVQIRRQRLLAELPNLPASQRTLAALSARYRISYETARRALRAAGIAPEPAAERRNVATVRRRARVLAAWEKLRPEQRTITAVAKLAGTRYGRARADLVAIGKISAGPQPRRKAAA